jgi:hypothetical protein
MAAEPAFIRDGLATGWTIHGFSVGEGCNGSSIPETSASQQEEKTMLKTNRVRDSPKRDDGVRFLVEQLWPRGIRKEDLKMKAWLKDVSPSPGYGAQ